MTDLKSREDTTARPPILDVLPSALRRQPATEACFCTHCAPELSDTQRAARERVKEDWRITRIAWCFAHDYQFVDLIRAEGGQGSGDHRRH